jgi:AraC family transcriptional regulator
MKNMHDLLKNVLIDIEEGIRNGINADIIARKHTLSSVHLQRLFKTTFKQTLGAYIRSRTLTESLNDLLHTDKRIIDIAFDYGYGYENSYSRSFRREFGISPNDFRIEAISFNKRENL